MTDPDHSEWWIEGPLKPSPGSDGVHLWRARLDLPPAEHHRLCGLLSPDEKRRAERLMFERQRRRFEAARGTLRTILARFLQTNPAALEFAVNQHGRPFLSGKWAEADLRFNLSHSAGMMLVAVAEGIEAGIDIEQIRPVPNLERIVRRFFAPGEAERLLELPEKQRLEAFFACWTRKEAFLKALGKGLLFPLKEFEVEFRPGRPAALLSVAGNREKAARWNLYDIDSGRDFASALVTAQ